MQARHWLWLDRLNAKWPLWLLVAAIGWIAAPDGAHAQTQSITIVSGNNQTGIVGTTLADPLVVRVRTRGKAGVPGLSVTFSVTLGNGSVNPTGVITDSTGTASTRLTLGTVAGTNGVLATAGGIGSVTFTATGSA